MITIFMVIWTIVVATMNHIMMNITEITTEIMCMISHQVGVQQLPLEDPLVVHQELPETMWWVSSAFQHFENKQKNRKKNFNFVEFYSVFFHIFF